MRPLRFALLISGVVAGSLAAGSAAFAQHGGSAAGHGGFAGHAGGVPSRGFAGPIQRSPGQITTLAPHAIAIPGRAVFPAPAHAFVVPGVAPQSGLAFQPAWRNRGGWHNGGWRDRDHDHDHDRGDRHRGYGFVGGYPLYASSWQLLPYDAGDSDFTGDSGDEYADQQGSAQGSVPAPPPDTGYRPEYPGYEGQPYPVQSADAAPPAPAPPIAPEPELTLIFKDGHTLAIHNYVLTSSHLVILDEAAAGRQQRVPLDQLDLPATEKAAQQAGLDFTPPA